MRIRVEYRPWETGSACKKWLLIATEEGRSKSKEWFEMAVTIVDIAGHAKVTKGTVSKILNNRHSAARISDGTRKRVLDIAKRMNYCPSFMARSLARGKTMTLGFICGDLQTPHFAELTSEMLHEAERRGYHLLISVTEWDAKKELQCFDTLLDGRVDGAVMSIGSPPSNTPQYQRIMENRFPIVSTNAFSDEITGVLTDFRLGMNQAVELLKSLGHERIGYVRHDVYTRKEASSKYATFHDVCRKYDIATTDFKCGAKMDDAIKFAEQLAADKNTPRAFVVYSDYTAMGIVRSLRQVGLDVPKDIDIIGIDGTHWGQRSPIALTSILQDRKQIAEKAVGVLMEKINSAAAGDTDTPARRIMIPSRLIVRETTKQKQ